MNIQIHQAETAQQVASVRILFLDYLCFIEAYLGQTLSFQGTETEFADFPHTYDALWLAEVNGKPLGAVGLKPFDNRAGELKRLWVAPEGRGHGIGEALCLTCIQGAREQGYSRLLLDTDRGLIHANSVYERLGFVDIDRYYNNPMDSRFMALSL